MRIACLVVLAVTAAGLPTLALAQDRLTPVGVFADAALPMQIIMLLLIVASAAAVVIAVRKLSSGPRLTGGSTFLQALRLGGPLIGLLGAVYNLFVVNLAITNIGVQPAYPVLAPGVAEASFLFLLGLVAGVVAVICNWAVEARIDRTVLGA